MSISLPEYRHHYSGEVVLAGRIHSRQALRLNVSTAPLGKRASEANGCPLKPVEVGAGFIETRRPEPGMWLILHASGGIAVLAESEFALTYGLERDPNVALLRDARDALAAPRLAF
jgi:hypothetical protein